MAYKIVYPGGKRYVRRRSGLRLQVMTAVFLLLFVGGVRVAWPEGWLMLEDWLIGETLSAGARAVQGLWEGIIHGG